MAWSASRLVTDGRRANPAAPDPLKIALSEKTLELPWRSRSRLLDRVGKHTGGLQVRLAFEAVGATRPVMLDPEEKHVLLQVIESWLAEPSYATVPEGIRELRDELQNEVGGGE